MRSHHDLTCLGVAGERFNDEFVPHRDGTRSGIQRPGPDEFPGLSREGRDAAPFQRSVGEPPPIMIPEAAEKEDNPVVDHGRHEVTAATRQIDGLSPKPLPDGLAARGEDRIKEDEGKKRFLRRLTKFVSGLIPLPKK